MVSYNFKRVLFQTSSCYQFQLTVFNAELSARLTFHQFQHQVSLKSYSFSSSDIFSQSGLFRFVGDMFPAFHQSHIILSVLFTPTSVHTEVSGPHNFKFACLGLFSINICFGHYFYNPLSLEPFDAKSSF